MYLETLTLIVNTRDRTVSARTSSSPLLLQASYRGDATLFALGDNDFDSVIRDLSEMALNAVTHAELSPQGNDLFVETLTILVDTRQKKVFVVTYPFGEVEVTYGTEGVDDFTESSLFGLTEESKEELEGVYTYLSDRVYDAICQAEFA